ncbi:KdsC family phosphatase [Vibrio mediterranei]|uniref:KdsC family phosphatase n=1 Tax=Vibrio mediterranei TaxID=689 RepID=UPI0040677C96
MRESKAFSLGDIKQIVMDVDGVLTDGTLTLGSDGKTAVSREFSVYDGLGIKLAIKAGMSVAVISARNCNIVRSRMKSLGVEYLYLGVKDKGDALEDLVERSSIPLSETVFIGDDLVDYEAMCMCAFSVAPRNANGVIRDAADYVTAKKGGKGAVREVIDLVLYVQEYRPLELFQALQSGEVVQ